MSAWPGQSRAKWEAEERRREWVRKDPPTWSMEPDGEPVGIEGFEAAERAREDAAGAWSRDLKAAIRAVMEREGA